MISDIKLARRAISFKALPPMAMLHESPFRKLVWYEQELLLSPTQILRRIHKRLFSAHSYDTPKGAAEAEAYGMGYHERRIAYLVEFPDPTPLCIKYNDTIHIVDGNHRLAAALIRGDRTIPVHELSPRISACILRDSLHDNVIRRNTLESFRVLLREHPPSRLRIEDLY